MKLSQNESYPYLSVIIGTTLNYGTKSPDFSLYNLGFGTEIMREDYKGNLCAFSEYSIHCVEGIVLYSNHKRQEYGYEDLQFTFESAISPFVGLVVRKITLSDKNDLWIDMGKCQLVIVTSEDNEESWRFLSSAHGYHIISSNKWIELDL